MQSLAAWRAADFSWLPGLDSQMQQKDISGQTGAAGKAKAQTYKSDALAESQALHTPAVRQGHLDCQAGRSLKWQCL